MSTNRKKILLRIFGWFSLIRVQNIVLMVSAQYLSAIYLFSNNTPIKDVLSDLHLMALVLASTLSILSGYIINSIYDYPKDSINIPMKVNMENIVSKHHRLLLYFLLNLLAVMAGSYVSFRATLFFVAYITGIWAYSYLVKRISVLGNVTSTLLAVTPFFALLLYYKNFQDIILAHAIFLFLLLLLKSFVRDLMNLSGDFANNYMTIPVKYGESVTKKIIIITILLLIVCCVAIPLFFDISLMRFYFYICCLMLIGMIPLTLKSKEKLHYFIFYNILKFVIVLGVFSIVLIDVKKL